MQKFDHEINVDHSILCYFRKINVDHSLFNLTLLLPPRLIFGCACSLFLVLLLLRCRLLLLRGVGVGARVAIFGRV